MFGPCRRARQGRTAPSDAQLVATPQTVGRCAPTCDHQHWAVAPCRAEGPTEVRTTTSQVALRRRRGFACVWLPVRYLIRPAAHVVLSIALPRTIQSPRWKEVVHPGPGVWMHHLEICATDDLDKEVADWLREAWRAAG